MKLGLLLLLFWSAISWSQTVNIAYADYPPYLRIDKPEESLLIAPMIERLQAANIKIELELTNWGEMEEIIQKKRILGFIWQLEDQPKKRKFYYSKPLQTTQNQFISLDPQFDINYDQYYLIKPYRIGIVRQLSYGGRFERKKMGLQLTKSNSDYLNLQQLIRQNIDLIIGDPIRIQALYKGFFTQAEQNPLVTYANPSLPKYHIYAVCDRSYGGCRKLLSLL